MLYPKKHTLTMGSTESEFKVELNINLI
jgi:hypothetical protein